MIPNTLRKRVLKAAHEGHQGIVKTESFKDKDVVAQDGQ